MTTKDRVSPSGPVSSIKGIIAIAATAVATTGAATQTGTFAGARVGNVVSLSPQENLQGSIGIAWARVVTDDTIAVAFNNVGASSNTGAITCDVNVEQR